MAMAIRFAIPMAASPAPWNRNVWSDIFVLVALREAKRPATATEAVPENKEKMGKISIAQYGYIDCQIFKEGIQI